MRLAVLSDIHANVFALRAVLRDVARRGADVVVNLGDTLYGPLAPKATYELLMEHDIVSISGNQDRQILEADEAACAANPTMQFVLDDLGAVPLHWMRDLTFDLFLSADVYLCHGSPADDCAYLLEDVSSGMPQVRRDDVIRAGLGNRFTDVMPSLILCGHTHIPRIVQIGDGPLIVNPGSVGLPAYTDDLPVPHAMETHSPHASYAIVERSAHAAGGWDVQLVRVAYDHMLAATTARALGREDWARALETGRV